MGSQGESETMGTRKTSEEGDRPPGRESDHRPDRRAQAAAERLLGRRDHGTAELRRKLLSRGFPADDVEKALAGLAGRGLLDDVSFARRFAEEGLAGGHGPAWIRAKLRGRGVTAPPAVSPDEEVDSLRALLARRRIAPDALTDLRERAKILRFLRGRGYSGAALARAFGDAGD